MFGEFLSLGQLFLLAQEAVKMASNDESYAQLKMSPGILTYNVRMWTTS